jgi:outer membrane protein OmpA-like peptidoglycan-associated protein
MKKAIALSMALISSSTLPMAVQAKDVRTDVKQATVFTTAGILGAIAGGPVGLFVGAVGGAYLGEQIKKADQLDDAQLARMDAEVTISHLSSELMDRDTALEQLQQQTFDQLQLQVLFLTGSDSLTAQGEKQLQILADFLNNHQHLNVHLHGYADPRGTEDYNEVLSHYRAISVKEALAMAGVDDARISVTAHGANRAKTELDNADTYALERRVDIEIINPQPSILSMQ